MPATGTDSRVIDHSSIMYRPLEEGSSNGNIGKQRGIRRGHGIMVTAVTVFMVVSTFFALLPGKSHDKLLDKARYASALVSTAGLAGTYDKALSWAERNDRSWPDDKCRQEFPFLYPQLEEVANYWTEKGGLTKSVVDRNEEHIIPNKGTGYTRVIIRNGQLFIRSFSEGPETRNSALIHHLSQAVASWPTSSTLRKGKGGKVGDRLPSVDLILSPGDKDTFNDGGGWAVTKKIGDTSQNGTWLIPDFGFVAWPEAGAASYEDFTELAAEVEREYPWEKKHDRMFWRGFANWYFPRRDLLERTSFATDSRREAWADVHETTFHPEMDKGDYYPIVALPEHCQHKYLIHTEGNSYSGRSKYLFSCRSITVAHHLEWTQHFHPALDPYPDSPNQNFIELLGPGFEGLEEAAMELRSSDSKRWFGVNKLTSIGKKTPLQVADNAARTLRDRYLTPAATMCYTRAALRHYADATDPLSWGEQGPQILPGQGVAPGSSKGAKMGHLKGDIEVGVWRLLGGPNWPPAPDPVPAPLQGLSTKFNQTMENVKVT
ncbi:hypothetical protein CBS101457_001568 [Exobasidium rhododendri]|nr:hypothetical protein CBS101457_001568 [Exobasidium rhododendri]